jgi:threonine/homoserine/homoserine lactone efflux protein
MNMHSWWTFFIATALICSSPGPNMLMMMSSSVKYGLRLTVYTMAGCYVAVMCMITASVAGLGAILKLQPMVFDTLRYAGAAYLIYLGIQAWRAPTGGMIDADEVAEVSTTAKKNFRKGFLVGISNPKALLFAAAFFPQFIDPSQPELPQFLILLSTFSVIELACYVTYATGGKSLSAYMKRENIRKAFNRFTGGLFAGFGVLLLYARQQ